MNLGFSETAFLVVLGLLLFGPKKLPEIGRQIGKFMAEFKRASAEFQSQLNDEVRQLEAEVEQTKRTILPPEGITARVESYLLGDDAAAARSGETVGAAPVETATAETTAAEKEQVPLGRAVTQGPNA
jgi:sec-independent protein translocase protein TatB